MPKDSEVWNYFTPLRDENGNKIGKATCNKCAEKKEFNTKGGTTNMWRHFLKHIKQQDAAAEGATRQPPVQMRAPPGPGSSSMDIEPADPGAQPPHLPSAPARPGASSSSMDIEPADSRVQPPPSAPLNPGGSSSDREETDMEEAKHHLTEMIALRGYDPSIIDDDCFRSFVKCLNPKFKVPSRGDIEAKGRKIFRKAMDDLTSLRDASDGRRISLAVGKAHVIETQVIYLAQHFIDDGWNLNQQVVYHAAINPVRSETRAGVGLTMVREYLSEELHVLLFTVAWGITDDHSNLKGYLKDVEREGKVPSATFADNILHSVAEHLYLNIDAEFRGRIYDEAVSFLDFQVLLDAGRDLWAYKEAWYSWYCFLIINNRYCEVIEEFEFGQLLCKIFGEIYRAIEKLCASRGPTANLCLVELFNVRKFLQSEIAPAASGGSHANLYKGRSGFADNKDLATVLTELTEILDKAIQESYLVWSIPLVLDPRYKLDFVNSNFRQAFVLDEAAHRCVPELLEALFSEYVNEECEHEWQRQAAHAQLHGYLTICVVPETEGFDILDWWKVHGSHNYPTVARMAKDALAMPTCNQLSSKLLAQLKGILRGYWCF